MSLAEHAESRIAATTWWFLAVTLSFLPIGVAWGFGIWPPVGTVQEAFSLAYTHRAMLQEDFYFAYTGHAALLLLASPSSFLTEWLLPQSGNFAKQEAFAHIFYGVHGTLLMGIFVAIWRSSLSMTARWLLLLVPFGITFLEPVTYLGLYINYHRLEQVLYLLLAWAVVAWVGRPEHASSTWFHVGLGTVAGIAFATKFSLAIVFLPYALATTVRLAGAAGFHAKRVLILAMACFATIVIVYAVYCSFSMSDVIRLMTSVRDLYAPGFLSQRTPFLMTELTRFLEPGGYYFALQLLAIVWLVLTAGTAWSAMRSRERWLVTLVTSDAVIAVALLMQFWPRQAMGTMLDITGFLVCGIAIKGVALTRVGTPRWSVATVAAVGLCYVVAVLTGQPWHELVRLAENSRIARQFDNQLSARPDLPIVFYLDGLLQPLLFPSADLLVAQGASSSPAGSRFLERNHPRVRFASAAGEREPFPHIAVIPEYLDAIPPSPAIRAEWPEMYARTSVLDRNRALARAFSKAPRHVYQFVEIRIRGGLLYFSTYQTRVTVYVAAT